MMEKILITGAAGFLGVNISKKLLLNDNNVIFGIDDFSSSDVSNLYQLLKNSNYNFIQGDVLDCELPYADKIFHFAGCATLEKYYENKYDFINKNLKILDKVFSHTNQTGAKLIMVEDFVDSSKFNKEKFCYYNYLNLAENLALEYKYNNKTNIKIARLSPLYGGNISKFHLQPIEKIIYKALENKNITLKSNYFDYYTFVDDAIEALVILMDKYVDCDVVDISVSEMFPISDIVDFIINYTKSKSKVEIKDISFAKANYIPDTKYLKKEFDFECSCDFKNNLTKTIDYFVAMYFS